MREKEIRVPVAGGFIIAGRNSDPDYDGVYVAFETHEGDVVDLALIECKAENGYENTDVYCYDDVTTEEYTRKYTVSHKDIYKALDVPYDSSLGGDIVDKRKEVEAVGATLLSVDEAKNVPKEILECGTWWWLRSPGSPQYNAAIVFDDGVIHDIGYFIDFVGNRVRPAFIIKSHNLQIGDAVEIYGIKATIVSDKYALVDNPIGMHRFDSESNDYEKSEIKAYIDNWFDGLKGKYKN